jgi:hypothetical protein
MSQLKDIAIGWYNFTNATSEIRKVMEKRLAVCDGCPNKVQVSPAGAFIMSFINDENNLFKCGLCGCPLGPLASHPIPQCQANKW